MGRGINTGTGTAASREPERPCWTKSSNGPKISADLPSSGSTDSLGRESPRSRKQLQRDCSLTAVWAPRFSARGASKTAVICSSSSQPWCFSSRKNLPQFRSSLIPLLQSNPDVVHESLQDQIQKFLLEPLRLQSY